MTALRKGYVPAQHGAWAMLLMPFLFGMFAAKPTPLHALLFAGWLLVYLLSYPLLQWLRTGKKRVYGQPAAVYGAVLLPVGALLIALHPALLPMALAFLPLFLVNCYYARRNRERSLVNDVAAVLQFSLIVFVAYEAGGGRDWRLAAELFALSALYFTGTVLYVKTMIREKHNPAYYRLSVGYHVALLAVAAASSHPALLIPFAVLLVRAAWSPRTKLTVKRSGMLEIAYSALILISVLWLY